METVQINPMTGEVMTLEDMYQHLRRIVEGREMEIACLREEITRLTHTKKSFRAILAKILEGQAQIMAYLTNQASTFPASRKQPQASSLTASQTYH